MQVSYQWLSEYVDLTNISPAQLADKMSRTGIEVEEVLPLDAGLKKIVVGEVLECVDHPNSDHLHICQVNIGDEVTQIVCGAPNVAAGQKVIVALPGARIVDNIKIKKGKIRGEVSNGMLCSLEELGLDKSVISDQENEGIYILPSDSQPGTDALPLVKMDDTILDLALTPNRADAQSLIGVGYEVAAIYNKTLTLPEAKLVTVPGQTQRQVQVVEQDLVPTYLLRTIKNVRITESPQWLQFHLMHSGIKPINNIVDITNYTMLLFGQPLHAYDANKLTDNVTIRKAQAHETFVALNDNEYELTTDDLVIADDKQVMALAGVIGGQSTSVTDETTDICLEAALFDGTTIRKTSQKHHLRTDASQRFEKGLDQNAVRTALDFAAALMAQYADGEVLEEVIVGTETEVKLEEITIALNKINQVLGIELTMSDVEKILQALQFTYRIIDNEILVITIPSRRFDIHIEADIIEEIGRLYGYNKLPNSLPTMAIRPGRRSAMQNLIKATRTQIEQLGVKETINYALMTEEKATAFSLNKQPLINLQWPMSEERSYLRNNLISGLLEACQYNVARKNNNLAFYEIGKVFTKEDTYQERQHLGLALTGNYTQSTWNQQAVNVDFYTLKGMIEQYLASFTFTEPISYVANYEQSNMHPYQTADIYIGDKLIGYFGQIHPETAKQYDLDATFVAEIDLESIQQLPQQALTFTEISKYPAVKRDIALLVDQQVDNATIEEAIWRKANKFLTNVQIFDLYTGANLATGKKSVAYQLTFQKVDATLTDEEIEQVMQKIINELQSLDMQVR